MQRGFTLIEIILVTALTAMLVLAAVPFFQSFSASHQIDANTQDVINVLRRAQSAAMEGKGDGKYGVHFTTGPGASFIFFKGDSYAARDASYDDAYTLPQSISLAVNLGGPADIIFSKLNGIPDVSGTVALSNNNGEVNVLNINQTGRINIQ